MSVKTVAVCACGKESRFPSGWCGACHLGYFMALEHRRKKTGLAWGFGEPPKKKR